LKKYKNIKWTINLSGCLLERLADLGYSDILADLVALYKRGQIEIVGTAYYHPLLPLTPRQIVKAQILEQEKILKKFFGAKWSRTGFFLPEMAYSSDTAELIKSLGYKWLILDEISYKGRLGQVDFEQVYRDKDSGLKIIFRARDFSNCYLPDVYRQFNQELIISATDAELYGLRHVDQTRALEKMLSDKKIKTLTISKYLLGKKVLDIRPLSSNWESSERDLRAGHPYKLWQDIDNRVHRLLWELSYLASTTLEKFAKDENITWAKWHLNRGLASCTFWWASGHDFSYNFGPYSWNPDTIERGLGDLIRALRSLQNPQSKKYKIKGEKIYARCQEAIWSHHWSIESKN
jgi:predicted glycosyl hydrolase (DUF1957 family)